MNHCVIQLHTQAGNCFVDVLYTSPGACWGVYVIFVGGWEGGLVRHNSLRGGSTDVVSLWS